MTTMNTLLAGAAVALSFSAQAQVSLPHSFAAGEPVRAAELNADLQVLAHAINDLQAQVDKLDAAQTVPAVPAPATLVSLAGTYSIFGYQSEVDNGGTIQFETYTGTMTITGSSFSYTSKGDGANNGGGSGFKTFTESGSASGTVGITGSTVTLTPTTGAKLTFTLAHGGATMFNIQNAPNPNASSGGQDLTLLIMVKH